MESKRRPSSSKSNSKRPSSSKSRNKRPASPASKDNHKQKISNDFAKPAVSVLRKKPAQQLPKKKIEELRKPEIYIKVNYRNKKLTIPLYELDDKGIHETVLPHIVRFEQEILGNTSFDAGSIVNWKTFGRHDPLKDYYFQTNKPIRVFQDQLLEIEPIWRAARADRMKLSDFELIKCIGTGGFSRVYLARLKATGVFYALKAMEKEGLFESGKECVVNNERNIMVGLNSPFLVNLEFAFQTKHFVVLALQYCPGGELFYYLRKVRRMTEDEARYCFVEILLGIQYLHGQGIIYRDIKPENIMIDVEGNLRIADFGLSKEGMRPNDLATTYCGSPEYMSPEMLAKSGHTFSVDYYCLGALLYELVTGNPPFYSRDVEKIYYSIQNQQIDFPPNLDLSPEIKMLLEGLLIKDPRRRLGSMGGVRQILGHPWVRKLKPADILNKTAINPIKIDLLTFNINEEEIEEGGQDFYHKFADEDERFDPEFEEFYFNRYDDVNILDEALPSVKSDSTKQNKSQKIQQYSTPHQAHLQASNGHKTAMSRETPQYPLDIHKLRPPTSEVSRTKQGKKLKKTRTKKQLNLIERAKGRGEDQSVSRRPMQREKSSANLKRSVGGGLKRIKSSTALLGLKKQGIHH